MLRSPNGWSVWIASLLLGLWSLHAFGDRMLAGVMTPSSVPLGLDAWALVAALMVQGSVGGLDHPTRRRIYEHLVALPGDYFRSITRSLGLGMGVTRHHLDVLLSRNLVYADKSGARIRYYVKAPPAQIEMNDLYAKYWRFRDTRERIVRVVQTMEIATPTKVARVVGISRQLAAYHLAQLVKAGLLRREKAGYRFPHASRPSAELPQ